MRICYLASASSIHTARWANHFCSKGHNVEIVSFDSRRGLDERVVLHRIDQSSVSKLGYFLFPSRIRRILEKSKIDILHAHYASSYGTLGRLCGLHPYLLSVWGSDVYEFPKRSFLHRRLLRKNLAAADKVCSTSAVMAQETQQYTDHPIIINSFGIDCDHFQRARNDLRSDTFVIGTVKALEPVYGIEYLIRGFALVKKMYRGEIKLRLVIAGEGWLRPSLQKLACDLGVENQTEFLGAVPHDRVPKLLNQFSVFAALSNSESFGVAVLEASACELPVVVTRVGNLSEIVRDGVTGLVIPPQDPEAAACAFLSLLENRDLREKLGQAGRRLVLENYNWAASASRMEALYESILIGVNPR